MIGCLLHSEFRKQCLEKLHFLLTSCLHYLDYQRCKEKKRSFIISFLLQLNRATYNILLDVSPIVDTENNVLQHYLASDLVQLGLWGNVVEKNMRVKVGILE